MIQNIWNLISPSQDLRPLEDSSQRKLASIVDDVIFDWAGLRPEHCEIQEADPDETFFELGVVLHGPRPGLLALRAPLSLGSGLAVAATGDPHAESFEREALEELAALLAERCVDLILHTDPVDFAKFRALAWPKENWPDAPARCQASLQLLGARMEVRLWYSYNRVGGLKAA